MQFFTLSSFALALSTLAIAAPSASDAFVPKDNYVKNVAPVHVQRLSDYVASHKDLTPDQLAFISKASTAVSTFDTASFPSLKKEIESLFTSADARYIVTGKTAATKSRREETNLLNKRNTCECSTEDSWCSDNTYCKLGADRCAQYTGCGWFDAYLCNGLCWNGS